MAAALFPCGCATSPRAPVSSQSFCGPEAGQGFAGPLPQCLSQGRCRLGLGCHLRPRLCDGHRRGCPRFLAT